MKGAQTLQLVFVGAAALAVYAFVRMAIGAEQRRACTPLCAARPDYAARNRLAPDFELPTLEGDRVRLSSFRGRVVVLNFWTRSCQPCREEMPSLAAMARAQPPGGPVVLAINTADTPESARSILSALIEGPIPFRVLLDPDGKVITERYGTTKYPETWVIDPQGVIRARFDGARNWTEPMVHELFDTLRRGPACDLEIRQRRLIAGPTWACVGLVD